MNKFFQILKDKKKLIIKVSCIIISILAIAGIVAGIHTYQIKKKNMVDEATENESSAESEI
ncbi:MAG: hypothetical protein GX913_05230, partial [Clostridiales bacterium]|nr:hypothetical protein [Clostridiales bacterium]